MIQDLNRDGIRYSDLLIHFVQNIEKTVEWIHLLSTFTLNDISDISCTLNLSIEIKKQKCAQSETHELFVSGLFVKIKETVVHLFIISCE